MKYYMGIDVGTNETKGVLINELCDVISFASRAHSIENPQPNYFEMDCEIWYREACEISRELMAKSSVNKEDVKMLGSSVMGCDCIAVDASGKPLMKAILYGIDSRAHEEIDYLRSYYGDQMEAVFHHELCSSDVAPKILWIKNKRPDVYAKTHKFLTGSSYLTYKFCSKYVVDRYLAEDFAPLYDLDQNCALEIKEPFFCHKEQLADVCTAMDVVGHLSVECAKDMGLSEHTQVLCGTGDSGAEALSTGVCSSGDLMVQLGSSCYFVYLCDKMMDSIGELWPSTFILPDTYSILAGTNTAGTLTKWYRDTLYEDFKKEEANGKNAYSLMAEDVYDIPAGSDGLITLPYFAGERTPINDPAAVGLMIGLTLTHTRSHMYHSALEGIAFSIAQHIEILKQHDLPIHKIMLVGGGTKNEAWMQIIADVLQCDVCTSRHTFGAAYGDALMAAVGDGAYASWRELEEVLSVDRIIHPNRKHAQIYKEYLEMFKQLYHQNKDIMHRL